MAAIALPSFLNQANKARISEARASTASTSDRAIDSLTGMSEALVGEAAFTLQQTHSDVETRQYVGSINRHQQAFEYPATADSLTGMSGPLASMAASTLNQSQSNVESSLTSRGTRQKDFIPILVPIFLGSTDPSTQTVGGGGVISWSIGFADVVRPSSSSTLFPITPTIGSFQSILRF